jgi:DNA processing protein
MSGDTVHILALSLVAGVGSHTAKTLISYCGTSESVFSAASGKLAKIPKIGDKIIASIKENKIHAYSLAEEQLKIAEKNNSRILSYLSPEYPSRLKNIIDSPLVLFSKGNANYENAKVLAIVGTRNATDYGKNFVRSLLEDIKDYNPLIISGLAYGIDISAHRFAMQYGVQTVGVMASGLQTVYPSAHKNIAEKMTENGGLLTEYIFGTKPDAPRFPDRNRIIAGLSDAVLVVEAKERGGALITSDLAAGYDREVLAVPGSVFSKTSQGCNNLIKAHKATMVTCAEDLVKALNWDLEVSESKDDFDWSAFSDDERAIIQLLREKDAVIIDDISVLTQIPVNQTAALLLGLEFKNVVRNLPGKKYKLNSEIF